MIYTARTAPRTWRPGYRRRLGQDPVSAGVGLAVGAVNTWLNSIQLSHDADTATTLIVNGLAQQLQNLDNAYFAEPASCANQRAALDAYDQAWLWLQSPAACGNPGYGAAGNRCISDRAPGGPTPWQSYYRDPIANDPRLSGQGCDTSQQVILPSLSTGVYTPTAITAGGGASTIAAPPAAAPSSTAAPASAPPTAPAPPATVATAPTTAAAIPPDLVLIGAALVIGYLVLK
jgi:hypothetical protein